MINYKPEIKEIGLDYLLTWPDLKVTASVSHIHQNFRGILAEIDISHEDWGILRGGVELTLGSQSSQKELVSSIKRRTKESPLDMDWDRIVEAIAIVTKRQYRHASIERLNLVDHMADTRGVRHCIYPFVVHDAINIIYGAPGSAKSYFALGLGLTVMTGERIVGFVPGCRHNILYLDWEDSPEEHGSRARRLLTGAGLAVDVDDIPYVRCYRGLPEITADLQRVIVDGNIELLIVDSAVYAGGSNPNEDDTVRAITSSLRQLNCTSLVIGHDTKEAGRGIRGSKMWEAMARGVWQLKLHSEPGVAEISVAAYHRKANRTSLHKSVGYTIRFDNDADTTRFVRDDAALTASPSMTQELSAKERIDAVLTQAMTKASILEAIPDIAPKTIENTLSRWGKKGVYVKFGTEKGAPLWGKASHESVPTLFPT